MGILKDFDQFLAKREVVERQVLFNFGKVPRYNLHLNEADKCFGRYLANREKCLYLINPVFDAQVCARLETVPLHFMLPRFRPSQRSAVDEKLAIAFRIDYSVALAFVVIAVVLVVRQAMGMQT